MRLVTPQQMKLLEDLSDKSGVSYAQLMERAGQQLSVFLLRQIRQKKDGKILFLCGNGNNGGDCFVAARLLSAQGVPVCVGLLCGIPKTILAYSMYKQLGDIPVVSSADQLKEAIRIADFVVDGVFGTGFHGTLRPEQAELFQLASSRFCIGVDIPSGGNCATGQVSEGTFEADVTIAFGALKTGMTQYPLKDYCGKIQTADIGIPDEAYAIPADERSYTLLEHDSLAGFPEPRRPDAHKGDFGRVLCITGSSEMRGAAALSVLGALRSGAGLVRAASCPDCINTVSVLAPEATFIPLECDDNGFMLFDCNRQRIESELKKADAVLIGCGLGVTPDTVELTRFVTENAICPVIIDADGLNCIASDIDILQRRKAEVIITPHPGEMARLIGREGAEINKIRFFAAEKLAEKFHAVVVLKGAGTVIADNHFTSVCPTGNPGMSKGGSGDVLAGIIASLAAQGYSCFDAARFGAYIHGLAGNIAAEKLGHEAMLPRDIIDSLSDSFRIIKEHK